MVGSAAFWRFLEQHFGISVDHHQEVVEVVGDATGEAADGIHFLGLAKLLFELTTVGDVFGDDFKDFFGLIGENGGAAAESHDNDAAVFAFPLHFNAIETSSAAAILGKAFQFQRGNEDVLLNIEAKKILDRGIAKHGDKGGIHVYEAAADGAAANAEGGAENQRARAGLGTAQGLFITLVFDGGGELL